MELSDLLFLTKWERPSRAAGLVLKLWDIKTLPVPAIGIATDLGLPIFIHGNNFDAAISIGINLGYFDSALAEFANCLLMPEWLSSGKKTESSDQFIE